MRAVSTNRGGGFPYHESGDLKVSDMGYAAKTRALVI